MDAILFLSDRWVDAVDQRLRAGGAATSAAEDDVSVVIRYQITGGPEGTGGYDLEVGPVTTSARRPLGEASVTLSMDWELAVAINKGNESAQRAFLEGRIVLGGDPQALLRNQEELARGNEEVAALRSATVYGPTV